MTAAEDLWESVELHYNSDTLLSLTNVNDNSATAVDDTIGELVSQEVIDTFPHYAEESYDAADSAHVAVARHAVVALLWRYGGSSTEAADKRWDEVFGDGGLFARLRLTNSRAHGIPVSNSGTTRTEETLGGKNTKPWADEGNLPGGPDFLPSRQTAN